MEIKCNHPLLENKTFHTFEDNGCTYIIPSNPDRNIKMIYDPPKWTIREAKVQGQDYTIELLQMNEIDRILILRKVYNKNFSSTINEDSVKLIIDCYNNWDELETFECEFSEGYNDDIKFEDLILKPIYDIQGLNHVKKNKYPLYNHAYYETEDGKCEIADDAIGWLYTWEFTV